MTSPVEVKDADPEEEREAMLNLFDEKRKALDENADYYESKRRPKAIGIATPPKMRELLANIGYPRIYVNAIANRLELEGFRLGDADEADETLWDWWQYNNLDVESTLGHTDAFVHGRSYITLAAPDPAVDIFHDPTIPIIRVEPPTNLYAEIDPRTRNVKRAIRAVYSEDGSSVVASTLYQMNTTTAWMRVEGEWKVIQSVPHMMGMVPVVPLSNRSQLSDLYGTSEITPELRSATDAAARIMMNMQATAELMAVPQRLLFGVKPQELGVNPETGQALFDAYIARILAFDDNEGKAQQFTAAELRNFTEALQEVAKQVASITGLPPQYLSTQSDNPASADAIRASETRLVMNAEHKCKIFGGAWEQAMRVATKVMNPGAELSPDLYRMEAIWRDPSTPTYAAKADAAAKLYAGGAGVIPKERARQDMGYSITERDEMRKYDEQEGTTGVLSAITGGARNPGAPAGGAPQASPPSEPAA